MNPAEVPSVIKREYAAIKFDIINDNYGDLFSPSATIEVKPAIDAEVSYPCTIKAYIKDSAGQAVSQYNLSMKDNGDKIKIKLPNLDQGSYSLALEYIKSGKVEARGSSAFSVKLPLVESDEFDFTVYLDGFYHGDDSSLRIAKYLNSIGFTSVSWLGGNSIKRGYDKLYRPYGEARFMSRMEAEGIRGQPVLYSVLFEILHATDKRFNYSKPGKVDKSSGLPMPDAAYPGKDFLAWNNYWLNLFLESAYGRMPLTKGLVVGDELTGTSIPISDRIKKNYEGLTGKKATTGLDIPTNYDFYKYYLNIPASTIWFSHSIFKKYNDKLDFDSVTYPNTFGGHSTAVASPFEATTALGSTSPDIYPFGEKKVFQKNQYLMALVYAASDFGKSTKVGLTGGQLSNNYYQAFPEQVFSGIAAGAKFITIFRYVSTNFEKNGRIDEKFAEIAKKTTADAGIIGRTLNNYKREQARVALLYPFTSHIYLSMGKPKNNDYLEMSGSSPQYLSLIYALESEFELFRRMAGHVDIIFDEQVQRGDLKKYDILVVGYCKQMEERTMREVVRYVKDGGTLFISTDSGKFNQYNKPSDILYGALPATPGQEVKVVTDYSETRLSKPEEWQTGNNLTVKAGAEVLFSFPDKQPACVIGKVGRGEALVLGMPFAGLLAGSNASKSAVVEYILNRDSRLISKVKDRDFSAITFLPQHGHGKVLMIFNGHKEPAAATVTAAADEEDASATLVDIVNGERIPFAVKDGVMSFNITCPAVWGRALALLKIPPSKPEVSVSGNPVPGEKFCYAVRLLGKDEQPTPYTLPVKVTITAPDGKVRDDLSGTRVVARGVYAFAFVWPSNAMKGEWKITVSDSVSGASDSATWTVK
jgi:hypothetical protein